MKLDRLLVVLGAMAGFLLAAPAMFAQTTSQTQVIPPGGKVDFISRTCGGAPFPCLPLGFSAQSRADQPVSADFADSTLTLTAPAGYAVQILSGCVANDGPATVVHCTVGGLSSPPTVTVIFTTVTTARQFENVVLFAGCNNISLTWPDGTPTGEVATAVTPAANLIAIWRFDNATQRFQGFSALPGAPNDLTAVNHTDPVFICMRASGTLARPST